MPYTIDGQPVEIGKEPQLKDGTLWVPLRPLIEALGGSIEWDGTEQRVTINLDNFITSFRLGQTTVNREAWSSELQAAPYEESGDTWVPVRFFNDPLKYALNVDLNTKQVDISRP